jgi:hypothetical protein
VDLKLLNEVKTITDEIKRKFDELYDEPTEGSKKQALLIYQIINKNIEALYKVKENILLKGNDEYIECQEGLTPFIRNLFKLCIYFIREQDYNISLTEQRLKNGDSDSYLKDEQYKKIINLDGKENYEDDYDKLINKIIAEYVDKTINATKERYLRSFGVFSDRKKAHKLIEKEYIDSTKYLEAFLLIKDIIYENFDNYDILITLIQNLTYELMQLYIELDIAIETKRELNAPNEPKLNNSVSVCFVIMDGLNSTINNSVQDIIDNTMALNAAISRSNTLKPFCKFKAYKQDEVHGYVAVTGNMTEFLDILANTYKPEMKVAYSLKPLSQINHYLNNVHETVYNMPFNLYGAICIEAREKMQYKHHIILGGNQIENEIELDDVINDEFFELNNVINDEFNAEL